MSHGGGTAASPPVHQSSSAEMISASDSHSSEFGGGYEARGDSRPGLIAATATSLEVGIANGTHGWLKIRAEMEGGVVTASLSAGSVAGQEMLHRELPSMTAYLTDERVGVGTLVIKQAPLADSSGPGFDSQMQRQGQAAQQSFSNANGDASPSGRKTVWGRSDQEAMYESWNGFGSASGFLPVVAGGNGSWLNVRV
jgi:hypothetical protein